MSRVTQPASRDDVRGLWPAVSTAHLFRDCTELLSWWEAEPWRVRVSRAGEAAVLGRWREHLDLLAVRGLWCSNGRIPVLIEDLRAVAREQGFDRLLGPLVPEDSAGPYVEAGMSVRQRIVVYRMQPPLAVVRPAPAGVRLRSGTPKDLEVVEDVDRTCFDDFWRYDPEILGRSVETERLGLAEARGRVIGYTLSTVHGAEATIGRLAVVPEQRGSGVGTALLSDAVANAARQGAAGVTLCTQEDNEASRRLYARAGFREARGRLVSTISAPLSQAGD